MKKYKPLFAILLTILTLVFIVFVGIMQYRFTHPEFTDLNPTVSASSNSEDDAEAQDDSDEAQEDESSAHTDDEDSEADDELTEEETDISTRTVIAETLNARSGPGVEYDITGVLVKGQVVEVEDTGDDWVKITTDEFSGYVNKNYLSED